MGSFSMKGRKLCIRCYSYQEAMSLAQISSPPLRTGNAGFSVCEHRCFSSRNYVDAESVRHAQIPSGSLIWEL